MNLHLLSHRYTVSWLFWSYSRNGELLMAFGAGAWHPSIWRDCACSQKPKT